MLPRPRKGRWAHRGVLTKRLQGKKALVCSRPPLDHRKSSCRLGTSQLRGGRHVSPPGPETSRPETECTRSGEAAAWTPASQGSTEEPVPGIPCLPGRPPPRFLSKRERSLELRFPFLPLNPEQMGFMLGFPLRLRNFPPEARGHCVQKRVQVSLGAAPRGPPRGARLAGVQGCDLGNQRHLPIRGLPSCLLGGSADRAPRSCCPERHFLSAMNGGAIAPAAQEAPTVSRLRKELLRTPEACVPPWTTRPAPPGFRMLVTQEDASHTQTCCHLGKKARVKRCADFYLYNQNLFKDYLTTGRVSDRQNCPHFTLLRGVCVCVLCTDKN